MNSNKITEIPISSRTFVKILENKKETHSHHSSLERVITSNTQNFNAYSFKDDDSSNFTSKERHSIVQKAKLHAIIKINDKSPFHKTSSGLHKANTQSLHIQTNFSNSTGNFYPNYDNLPKNNMKKIHDRKNKEDNLVESEEHIYYQTDFNSRAFKTTTQKSENLRIYDNVEDSLTNEKDIVDMVNYYTSSIKVLQTDPGITRDGSKEINISNYNLRNNKSHKSNNRNSTPEKRYSVKPAALDKNKIRKYFWGYEQDSKNFKRENHKGKFYSVNESNNLRLSDYILRKKNPSINNLDKSQKKQDGNEKYLLSNSNTEKFPGNSEKFVTFENFENKTINQKLSRGGIVDLSLLNYRINKKEKSSEVKIAELSQMDEEENEYLMNNFIIIQRWWKKLYYKNQEKKKVQEYIKPIRLNRFDRPTGFILNKQHVTNLYDLNISKIQNLWKIRKIRKEILKKKKDSTYDMTSFTNEFINKKIPNLQIINNQDNAVTVIREKKPISKPILNSDFVQKKVISMNFEKGIKKIQYRWKKYKISQNIQVKRKIKILPISISKKINGPVNTYLVYIIKIQRHIRRLLKKLSDKKEYQKLIVPKFKKITPFYLSKEYKTNYVPKLKNINLIQPIFITKENKSLIARLKIDVIIKNMKRFLILQNMKKLIKNKKTEIKNKPIISTCRNITKNNKLDLNKTSDKIKALFFGFKARKLLKCLKNKLQGLRKVLAPSQFITKSFKTSLFNRKATILQKAFRKSLSMSKIKKSIKIDKSSLCLSSSNLYIDKSFKSNFFDFMSMKIARALRRFFIKSKIRQSKIILPVTKPKSTHEFISKSNKNNFIDKKVLVLQKFFKKFIANKKKSKSNIIKKIYLDESPHDTILYKLNKTNYFDYMSNKIIKAMRRHAIKQKILSKKINVLSGLIKLRKKNEDRIERDILDKWNKKVKNDKEKLNKFIEKLEKSQSYRFIYLLKRLSDQIDLDNENNRQERIKNTGILLNNLSDKINFRQKSSTFQDFKNIYDLNLKDESRENLRSLFTSAYKVHILPYFLPVKERLNLIDFTYQLSETIRKSSQEFALIKILNQYGKNLHQAKNNFEKSQYINLTQIEEIEFSPKTINHYFYTLRSFLEIRKSDKFENCPVNKHLEEKFPKKFVRNIFSYKWWSPLEKNVIQNGLADAILFQNKYDENLVDFIFQYVNHTNKIKTSKKLIIARLKRLRNLNNTNIFSLIKLQEFIYLQTLKIKEHLCSDCYCDEAEINLSAEDACECDCHLSESSDIDEEVNVPAAKYSMKNDVLLYKKRDDEEDILKNSKNFNIKYKITKIEENEDTDEVDVLDLINPNKLRTSKASNMVKLSYSKLNLTEKKKDEGKIEIVTEMNDSDEYSRIKYIEDDAQSEMHSVHDILTSRSKANFDFSPDKFEKPETPRQQKLQFLLPRASEAHNLIRKSVVNHLNNTQSNLKLRDNNENDELRMNNNYIKKLSSDVFLRKESLLRKDI